MQKWPTKMVKGKHWLENMIERLCMVMAIKVHVSLEFFHLVVLFMEHDNCDTCSILLDQPCSGPAFWFNSPSSLSGLFAGETYGRLWYSCKGCISVILSRATVRPLSLTPLSGLRGRDWVIVPRSIRQQIPLSIAGCLSPGMQTVLFL
jgi:hypothetical protein